ncbi:hypothetical protein [Streptomyces chryseus]
MRLAGSDSDPNDGQAGTYLGLHVAGWEADQSSSAWYDKLFEVLQEVVDGLEILDLLNNFNPTFAGDLIGYAPQSPVGPPLNTRTKAPYPPA